MDWDVATTHLAIAVPGTPLYEYWDDASGKPLKSDKVKIARETGLIFLLQELTIFSLNPSAPEKKERNVGRKVRRLFPKFS